MVLGSGELNRCCVKLLCGVVGEYLNGDIVKHGLDFPQRPLYLIPLGHLPHLSARLNVIFIAVLIDRLEREHGEIGEMTNWSDWVFFDNLVDALKSALKLVPNEVILFLEISPEPRLLNCHVGPELNVPYRILI